MSSRQIAPNVGTSSEILAMSDYEWLTRLAQALETQDSELLDEVARLIGRLAVTIE